MEKKIFFLLLMILFSVLRLVAQQQEPIELVHSNYLYATKKLGKNIQILKGQVIVSHKMSTIYCDSAYIDRDSNLMKGYGDVRVIKADQKDTVLLYCDSLIYNANARLATFRGNVRLIKDTIRLFTNELLYNFDQDKAYYLHKGKIITKTDTLISIRGYYNTKEKNLAFSKNVVLLSQKYDIYTDSLFHDLNTEVSYFFGKTHIVGDSMNLYCTRGSFDHRHQKASIVSGAQLFLKTQIVSADAINYDRASGNGTARGNVVIIDTVEKYRVTGELGKFNDKTKEFFITRQAVLTQFRDQDTLWLHSDTIYSFMDTLYEATDTFVYRKALAYHHVKGFQRSLQVKTDSLVYSMLDSTLFLYGSPVLWSDSVQISGNFMELLSLAGEPYKLVVDGNAFIIEHTREDNFNQIKGDKIEAFFRKRAIYRVDVDQNASAIYFLTQDSVTVGINKIQCDTIRIFIKNKRVHSILAIGKPKGKVYPPSQLSEDERKLEGFQWLWYFRPLKPEEIMIWSKKN